MLRTRSGSRGWLSILFLSTALLAAPLWAAAPEPAIGERGMVVSPHPAATRAGVAVLERGGNAVDAAVATAFAVAVTQPQSTGIGGGGFLLIRLADGRAFAVDARETAPAASTAEMFTQPGIPERASVFGGLAVGTPGLVAGLALAAERWGTLPLADLIAPAARLAEDGYEIGPYQAGWIRRIAPRLPPARFPETAGIHFIDPEAGADLWLRQPELGATLRRIARQGPRAFYRGPIAEAIAKAAQAYGGILTTRDLADYRPVVREPIRGRYRAYDILSFPPPSSGGIALVQILNILEGFRLAELGAGSSATIHRVTEAMKLAFADRAAHLGDADFHPVPVERLTSKSYARELRARMSPAWWRRAPWRWGEGERAMRVAGPGFAVDDRGTAHLSVTDGAGNAVAITGTINGPFGSLVTVPGTGILLNNEMDDFVTDPDRGNLYGLVGIGGANRIEPGKRPLSSMAPTIVVDHGRVRFVAGSNGGPRIITSVLLSILNTIDFEMDASEAVSAPRYHHQWRPDLLKLERDHPEDVVEGLRRRGHTLEVGDELVSGVMAIAVDPKSRLHEGAVDPRRDGLALGY